MSFSIENFNPRPCFSAAREGPGIEKNILGWKISFRIESLIFSILPLELGEGSGGVKSAGVSQSVRETGRDESQSVPSPEKLFKTRDLELPIFEGSVPSCSPHSAGYTRTSVHPYFPVTN